MPLRRFVIALALLLAACSQPAAEEPRTRLTLSGALGQPAADGFARATTPRQFRFPEDHGPHPEYAAEWWYYTGNLEAADGRQFGFQLTFFRFGLTAEAPQRASDWATSQIYMAHFALSDVAGNQFYAAERFSRAAAGLAGAQAGPFQVWVDDWSAEADLSTEAATPPMHLRAADNGAAIDLRLEPGKSPVLQGDQGLSQKSAEPGNASYYYSLTRMPASGSIWAGGSEYKVTGLAWMDREWSTSALAENQVGWDWFALQLDDGRELMLYRLRLRDGGNDPYSHAVLIGADGTSQPLTFDDLLLTPTGSWRSPRSGAEYPAGWRIQIPQAGLDLEITPYLADQELPLSISYWEGAVRVTGISGEQPLGGSGYVELTGYSDS